MTEQNFIRNFMRYCNRMNIKLIRFHEISDTETTWTNTTEDELPILVENFLDFENNS